MYGTLPASCRELFLGFFKLTVGTRLDGSFLVGEGIFSQINKLTKSYLASSVKHESTDLVLNTSMPGTQLPLQKHLPRSEMFYKLLNNIHRYAIITDPILVKLGIEIMI